MSSIPQSHNGYNPSVQKPTNFATTKQKSTTAPPLAKWRTGDMLRVTNKNNVDYNQEVVFGSTDKDDEGNPIIICVGGGIYDLSEVLWLCAKVDNTEVEEVEGGVLEIVYTPPLQSNNKNTVNKNEVRWKMFNAFIDNIQKELTSSEALIWLTLFRHTREGVCSVGITKLMKDTGLSEKAVRNCIKWLIDKGYVTKIKRGGINRGLNVYQISVSPSDTENS